MQTSFHEHDDIQRRLHFFCRSLVVKLGAIFKPFSRVRSQDEYNGSGLGLSIEKNGGSIEAESIPGEGNTFFVDAAASVAKKNISCFKSSGVWQTSAWAKLFIKTC